MQAREGFGFAEGNQDSQLDSRTSEQNVFIWNLLVKCEFIWLALSVLLLMIYSFGWNVDVLLFSLKLSINNQLKIIVFMFLHDF